MSKRNLEFWEWQRYNHLRGGTVRQHVSTLRAERLKWLVLLRGVADLTHLYEGFLKSIWVIVMMRFRHRLLREVCCDQVGFHSLVFLLPPY